MKRKAQWMTAFGLSIVLLAGCGTTAIPTDTPGQQAPPPPALPPTQQQGEPPAEKTLTYNFEGGTETEQAQYWEGQNGYYLYVPERLTASQEEPGKDVLLTKEIPTCTMRIEVLSAEAKLEEQKAMVKEQLQAGYPNGELIESKTVGDPVFDKVLYEAGASDESTNTTIRLILIDGKTYKITTHIWKSEIWAATVFDSVIKTIGSKQE